jgi:hypothetical protein
LHTYNINTGTRDTFFSSFNTSRVHFDKATNDPRLFSDTQLKSLSSIHQYLRMFESLHQDRLQAGEELAELARNCVFEIEDTVFNGGVDSERFCKFLDTRLAKRLLARKSTEEFWRQSSASVT